MADMTIDDVLSFLKGNFAPPSSSHSENSNAPIPSRREKGAFNTTTKGEIEAAKQPDGDVLQLLKDYLGNLGKTATITARTAMTGGAAALDGVKNLGSAALGGRRPEPLAHTNDAVASLRAAAEPLLSGAGNIPSRRDIGEKMGLVYDEPASAFGGNPAARTVAEGVPASGPVSVPQQAAVRGARAPMPAPASADPQGGAFVRTGGAGMNGANVMPAAATGGDPSSTATAEPAAKEGAFSQPAQPSFKNLAEEFKKRSGELNRDPDGKLTPEQKANAELNFFLGLMAKSARPGARMLGAFGESGQEALKGAGEQQEKNLARGDKKLQGQRDDLYREMGFADKDEDNKRGDARQRAEEKRWQATDKKDTERLDIMRKQFERDGQKVVGEKVLANGNIGFMTADKKVIDSGVKAKGREPTANETVYGMLTRGGVDTQEALDRIFPPKPKNNVIVVDEDMGQDETGKLLTAKRPFDLTTNEYLRPRNAAPSGPLKFSTPQELEAAIKSGKVKRGDKVMTPAGEKVVR